MLEMFFDNEKVFSVFRQMLKSASENKGIVCMPRILYDFGISVEDASHMLQSFEFLGIILETEDTDEKGIFKLNVKSSVVLALCSFDEIVGKVAIERIKKELFDDGDDDMDEMILDLLLNECDEHICSCKRK